MKSSTIMILTITLASTYAFTTEQSDTIRRLMDLIDHVKGYDKMKRMLMQFSMNNLDCTFKCGTESRVRGIRSAYDRAQNKNDQLCRLESHMLGCVRQQCDRKANYEASTIQNRMYQLYNPNCGGRRRF